MSSMRLVKDQMHVKNIRKFGMSDALTNFNSINRPTNATINKFFMFPVEISAELHYFHNNVKDIMKFIETFLILGGTDCFNFFLKFNENMRWLVHVAVTDDSISIPEYDLEDSVNPAAMEIVIQFTVASHCGFIRDVAKVNDQSPTITFLVGTAEETVENLPKDLDLGVRPVDELKLEGF